MSRKGGRDYDDDWDEDADYNDGDWEEDGNEGNTSQIQSKHQKLPAVKKEKPSPVGQIDKKSAVPVQRLNKSPVVEKSKQISATKIKEDPEGVLAQVMRELQGIGINLKDLLPNITIASNGRAKTSHGGRNTKPSENGVSNGRVSTSKGRDRDRSPTAQQSPVVGQSNDGSLNSPRNGAKTPGRQSEDGNLDSPRSSSPRSGSRTPGRRGSVSGVQGLKTHQQYDSKSGYFGYGGDDKTIYEERKNYYAAQRAIKEQKKREEMEMYASRRNKESVFGGPAPSGRPPRVTTPEPLPGRLRGQEQGNRETRSSSPRYRAPSGKLRTSLGQEVEFRPKSGSLKPWPNPFDPQRDPEAARREALLNMKKEKAIAEQDRNETTDDETDGGRSQSSARSRSRSRTTSLGTPVEFKPHTGSLAPLPDSDRYDPKTGLFGYGIRGEKSREFTEGDLERTGSRSSSEKPLPVVKPLRFVPTDGPLEVHSSPAHTPKVVRTMGLDGKSSDNILLSPHPPGQPQQGISVRRARSNTSDAGSVH